jgi:hypothetical protein
MRRADFIMASDVVFCNELVPVLLDSVLAIGHERTVSYIANEVRDLDTCAEFRRAAEARFRVKQIPASKMPEGFEAVELFELRPR